MLPFSSGHFIFHPFPFHSSLNSVNSSDSRGSSGSHSHSPSSSSSSSSSHHLFHHHHARHRYRSSTLPQQTPARLSSISSHDSGFISSSHDQYASSKSSSPMPAETKVRKIPQLSALDHRFGLRLHTHGLRQDYKTSYALWFVSDCCRGPRETPKSAVCITIFSHISAATKRQFAGSGERMWSWWSHLPAVIITQMHRKLSCLHRSPEQNRSAPSCY